MPDKLKVLVALLVLSTVLAAVGQRWISLAVNLLLLVGVLKGSEGARTALMLLAVLGMFGAAFFAVVGGIALGAGGGTAAIIAFVAALFAAGVNGFMLWCLRQGDVQHWMFHKSMKPIE
jgi:hypothetical protein